MSNEINENELLASIGIDTTNKDLETVIEEMSDKWEELNETESYITFDEFKSKFEQEIPINEILIIKKYIPIMEKRVMLGNILSSAKDYTDNGMTKIDYINLELSRNVYVLETLSNYAFTPDTMIQEIDYMLSNGIITSFNYEIGSELLWDIENLINEEIKQIIEIENSISNVVNKHMFMLQDHIETIIEKIPSVSESTISKWVDKLSKSIKNFSPENYAKLQEMISFSKGSGK